jgi:hydrogenase maturation protease
MRTLILGIGNTLLADEGIGVHVIQHLQDHQKDLPDTALVDGGTLSFTLATAIEDADNLIVIDAAQLHAEPGTVKTFIDSDMDEFLQTNKQCSVHEVGLLDLMTVARLADQLPARRALIGIQPQKIDWGEHPTDEVGAAIPSVCRQVKQLVKEWRA